jgi:hypothetical protein
MVGRLASSWAQHESINLQMQSKNGVALSAWGRGGRSPRVIVVMTASGFRPGKMRWLVDSCGCNEDVVDKRTIQRLYQVDQTAVRVYIVGHVAAMVRNHDTLW